MIILTAPILKLLLIKRQQDTHKGNYGHALIIAGTKGKMGAAVIAATAAARAGCGLVTANIPVKERAILQTNLPEAMLHFRQQTLAHLNHFSAIGIGPALGINTVTKHFLKQLFTHYKKPIVVDADGLNVLAKHPKLIKRLPPKTILTPHPKEFDRLFGAHQNEQERRITATKKASELDAVIVLKGHHTCIIDNIQFYSNNNGNAGLAKGGSGDALTGVITAFLAQGYSAIDAALLGVYLHGLAADIALQQHSMESLLITDVIKCFGKAFDKMGA